MNTKKGMNIGLAAAILLAFAGFVFIMVNNTGNMYMNDSLGNGGQNAGQPAGDPAKAGDFVAMAYTGRLEDGTVFDSNLDPQFGHVEPFIFELGSGQVIPGWDRAIVGMKVGEKKTITVPPEEAYGAEGIPGVIPPNATLIFDVELLAIKSN